MQVLYAVDFEIGGPLEPNERHQALSEHIARWLSNGSSGEVTADDLARSGSALLPPRSVGERHSTTRSASWEVVEAGGARALRVSVTQLVDADVELTTRVTVATVMQKTWFRVGLSREQTAGYLSPVRDTPIFQPGVLGMVVRDDRLNVSIGAQRIDDSYLPIRTASDAELLVHSMGKSQRLPIVLVHLRSPESWALARLLSTRLIGLARVITLNHSTSRQIFASLPIVNVPFGGALLVWSDLNARGVSFTGEEIALRGIDNVRARLMSRLAAISALARGIDEGWRSARTATQQMARSAAEERVLRAIESDDHSGEVEALRSQVSGLKDDLNLWQSIAEESEEKRVEAESLAENAEDAIRNADYWREQYEAAVTRSVTEDVVDVWDLVPILVARSDPQATFRALEDAAQDRIVFTDSAQRSWKSISYPDAADMTLKLKMLARGAVDLYGPDSGPIGHLDDWFAQRELKVASSDQTISRSPKLRTFDFEGREYSQVMHVKVRDGVKPNEVGRIHFDLDKENQRIVVNHVAVKLYSS